MKLIIHLLLSFLCLSLVACDESDTYAPVTELSTIQPIPKAGVHYVGRGETVYEIAWRYGLDYRYLAARNQIRPPYAIYVGQTIYLRGKPVVTLAKAETKALPVLASNVSFRDDIPRNLHQVPSVHLEKKPSALETSVEPHYSISKWAWPAKGKILNRFSSTDKGVNIAGRLGEPIYAAAGGKVVYAGNGLRGYGNLIILKHNSLYLSAYAHNKTIFVREGDWVKQGQKIAEMGNTGTDKVMLHFEIRRSGLPLNPISLYR